MAASPAFGSAESARAYRSSPVSCRMHRRPATLLATCLLVATPITELRAQEVSLVERARAVQSMPLRERGNAVTGLLEEWEAQRSLFASGQDEMDAEAGAHFLEAAALMARCLHASDIAAERARGSELVSDALALLRGDGDPDLEEAREATFLSACYAACVELAERHYWQASEPVLRAAIDVGNEGYTSWLRLLFAEVLQETGRLREAEQQLIQIRRVMESKPQAKRTAFDLPIQALTGHASILLEFGLLDLAERSLREAEALLRQAGDMTAAGESISLDASSIRRVQFLDLALMLALGDHGFEMAIRRVDQWLAEDESRAANSRIYANRSDRDLLRLRQAKARVALARRTEDLVRRRQLLDEAAPRIESIVSENRLSGMANWEAGLLAADIALLRGQAQEALERLERAEPTEISAAAARKTGLVAGSLRLRSRAHRLLDADEPVLRRMLHELTTLVDQRVEEWRRMRARPGGRGFLHFAEQRLLMVEILELHLRLDSADDAARAALDLFVQTQSQGSLFRTLAPSTESWTLDRIRRALCSEGRALLYLFPTLEGTYRLLLDEERVELEVVRDARRPMLSQRRRALVEALWSRPEAREEARALACQLAEALLPDALTRSSASWSEVSVGGLELLGWMPFDLLPLEDGEPIGLSLPITHLPSIPVGVLLAERAEQSASLGLDRSDLLTLAATGQRSEDSDRDVLALSDAERSALRDVVAARHVVHFDSDAHRAMLIDALPRLGALNLFGHSEYDPDAERPVSVRLAPGPDDERSRLTAEDVEAMGAMPRIVVLNACGTLRAPDRFGGDGSVHLAGSFLRSGSTVVLVSGLPLRVSPSLEFSAAYFRHLDLGCSATVALTRARRDLHDANPGRPLLDLFSLQCWGWGHAARLPRSDEPEPGSPSWLRVGALLLAGLLAVGGIVQLRRTARLRPQR